MYTWLPNKVLIQSFENSETFILLTLLWLMYTSQMQYKDIRKMSEWCQKVKSKLSLINYCCWTCLFKGWKRGLVFGIENHVFCVLLRFKLDNRRSLIKAQDEEFLEQVCWLNNMGCISVKLMHIEIFLRPEKFIFYFI